MARRALRRMVVVAGLAAFGVAAFATISSAPLAVPAPATTKLVESLPIDPDETLLPSPSSYVREEQYRRGDTHATFLHRLGIAEPYVERMVKSRVLHKLRPGTPVSAVIGADGAPYSLTFLEGRDVLVEIGPDGRATERSADFETHHVLKASVIESSLFAAADAAGIPDSVAMQLADIFSGDIDFYRDLRKEDRFIVVYEMHTLQGRPVRAGRVLAAEFVNKGETYRAVHFDSGYYAPDGENMRKAFLRSPLEFSRVTSGFGMRRHPIARKWRAHKGIDYGAPTGTRVRAVADGVVEFAGRKGGYGNVVILRHQGRVETLYAHLSRFASGVRRGARVAQSDTIGFVGSTGWATGPHLHYEFHVAGKARNPFKIAMPAAKPVPAARLAEFHAHAEPLVAGLDLLANVSPLAQAD